MSEQETQQPVKYCRNCGNLNDLPLKRTCSKCRKYRALNQADKHRKFIELIGGKCMCNGKRCWHEGNCTVNDIDILQGDHINGNGTQIREQLGGGVASWYYYISHPDEAKRDLQALCANCNWKKRIIKKEGT